MRFLSPVIFLLVCLFSRERFGQKPNNSWHEKNRFTFTSLCYFSFKSVYIELAWLKARKHRWAGVFLSAKWVVKIILPLTSHILANLKKVLGLIIDFFSEMLWRLYKETLTSTVWSQGTWTPWSTLGIFVSIPNTGMAGPVWELTSWDVLRMKVMVRYNATPRCCVYLGPEVK